jgi:GntR family transcriptional repressor for pyruvate dehydrogenase complex
MTEELEIKHTPIQPLRLYEEVSARIRQRILSGDLQPGDKLPSESVLTEQFAVSRTVIREAIQYLQTQGLVRVKHGSGVYVRKPSINTFVKAFSNLFQMHDGAVFDLHHVRAILEIEIAALAAERASEEDIQALGDCIERMESPGVSLPEYVEMDLAFHRIMATATHNDVFLLILQPLVDLLRQSRMKATLAPSGFEKSLAGHKRIFECVKNGNVEGSRAAMRTHLRDVRERLEVAMESVVNRD